MKVLKKSLQVCLAASAFALSMPLSAMADQFTIKKIKIKGLQRIEQGTVFNVLPVKVGDDYQDGDAAAVLQALFRSGFFSDVKVGRDNNTLVISVKERAAIGRMNVEGNKEIDTDDLLKGLNSVGIAEGRTYDQSILGRVTHELEQQYYSRGKYGVVIKTNVKKLPRNRVSIDISIKEGESAKIKKISIVGNQRFDDDDLLDLFKLTTSGWFTWLSHSDRYAKEKFQGDLESLRTYYLDHGYLHFKIDSTQVAITPDKKDIYITINVTEGEQYKISKVALAGDLIVPRAQLEKLILVKPGDNFVNTLVTATNTSIADRLGDEGYAFAKVNAVQDIDEKSKTVKLTFFVDPANRAYVRRINFFGNHNTDSEVLRREARQMESTWVSSRKIKQSRTNLMLLGFFENVDVKTNPVPGRSDLVDIDFTVKEQPSGQLTGGIGYSQVDGLLFNLGVKQNNFMGTGRLVDFSFNRSAAFTSYRVNYNNPYWTIDGISRGFSAYYQETDLGESNIANYTRDLYGASMAFGIPISEHDRLSAGLNIENTSIKKGNDASLEVREFIRQEGSSFDIAKMTLNWNHVTLDRRVFPTKGLSSSVSVQASVPGSDLEFYTITNANSYYMPLSDSRRYVMLFKNSMGYGNSYGNTHDFPLLENFYSGGISSVRGFRGNTLGPMDSKGDPIGGSMFFNGTAEFIFPVPFVETNALRTSFFVDAGNVYTRAAGVSSNGAMRYSVGITAQWMSPIGPFVLSFGKPINDKITDDTEPFQFTIGTTF